MQHKLCIGLIGFGVVGEGVYQVILNTPSLQASIKKIAIKHPNKKRNAPSALFTNDVNEILHDDDINVVVELIDDADEAYWIVRNAFEHKKHVVSANKKMIALHLPELISLQQLHQVSFLYEAAVCGSIPIIRNLEEYFDNDLLHSISGIVNGSTNFILTKMNEEGWSYHDALNEAQLAGFAESDPSLDVEGKDAVNKLTILLKHTFGIECSPNDLLHKGITQINPIDTQFAIEKALDIKLVANAFRISNDEVVAFVLPQFVERTHQLAQVKNEYNGVLLSSSLADAQFLYGKGAGRYPTSSAVLSDLSALRYGYRYEYKKSLTTHTYRLNSDDLLTIYVSATNEDLINRLDFEQIHINYHSPKGSYLIGKIQLCNLIKSTWIHDPNVSIIHFPDEQHDNQYLFQSQYQEMALAI